MSLPPCAGRLDGGASWATFAAGTLGTVRDPANRIAAEPAVLDSERDPAYLHDVQHPGESRWTEAERQAFLARAQYDPRERRA